MRRQQRAPARLAGVVVDLLLRQVALTQRVLEHLLFDGTVDHRFVLTTAAQRTRLADRPLCPLVGRGARFGGPWSRPGGGRARGVPDPVCPLSDRSSAWDNSTRTRVVEGRRTGLCWCETTPTTARN